MTVTIFPDILVTLPSLSSPAVAKPNSCNFIINSPRIDINWAEKFKIPESEFPSDFVDALESGSRPEPSSKSRRRAIQVLVSKIMETTAHPGRKSLNIISKLLVQKSFKSFEVIIDGKCLSDGHETVMQ